LHYRASLQVTYNLKNKTEALKRSSSDLAHPTAPATPPQGRFNLV